MSTNELTPETLLYAYSIGIFPMANPDDGHSVSWYSPDPRAILPLDTFHVPANLKKKVDRNVFDVRTDQQFERVIRACAAPRGDLPDTWISEEIIHNYVILHEQGFAHSVECYLQNELVGGLYGVAMGGAFFGESMFFRERDASKVALVHLVNQLKWGGFTLLDVQYTTSHLEQFGVTTVSRRQYLCILRAALAKRATWWPRAPGM